MDISQKKGNLILPDRVYSHQDFKVDVLRFADELQLQGIGGREDDRVILKCSNSYTFCVALFSLMHMNTSIVLIDVEMNQNDVDDIQERAQAKWFLTEDDMKLSDSTCVHIRLPLLERNQKLGQDEKREISLKGWLERRDAVILFSSGSTGKPKGMVKSGRSIFCNLQTTAEVMRYRADDVLLPMVPFSNTWGFFLLIIWWLMGCSLFICNYRYTGNLLKYVIRHKITIVEATIPTTYATLQLLKRRTDLLEKLRQSALRMWYTSGAHVPNALKDDFFRYVGQPLLDYYGSSEAGNISAGNSDDWVGTGRVMPRAEVKIVDDEWKEVSSGQVGDIYVKCDGMMEGYLIAPKEYKLDLKDGWFDMKDFGYLDETGHLHVLGRKDEAIHRMGSTFYSYHTERMVEDLGVLAKVVALPDEKKGAYLVLYVQYPKKDISIIRKKILKILPTYMYPDRLICVEEFPYLPNGKVDKKELERRAEDLRTVRV